MSAGEVMSTRACLLSQSDIKVLKALAKHTQNLFKRKIRITVILDTIAQFTGVPNWTVLMGFNQRDVLFSDVSSIIKKNYPLILQSVMHSELEENVAIEICEKYAAHLLSTFKPFDSSKYGDSCVNGSEIYLCLQPTGETDEYRV
jgi:hypothetical protein